MYKDRRDSTKEEHVDWKARIATLVDMDDLFGMYQEDECLRIFQESGVFGDESIDFWPSVFAYEYVSQKGFSDGKGSYSPWGVASTFARWSSVAEICGVSIPDFLSKNATDLVCADGDLLSTVLDQIPEGYIGAVENVLDNEQNIKTTD